MKIIRKIYAFLFRPHLKFPSPTACHYAFELASFPTKVWTVGSNAWRQAYNGYLLYLIFKLENLVMINTTSLRHITLRSTAYRF